MSFSNPPVARAEAKKIPSVQFDTVKSRSLRAKIKKIKIVVQELQEFDANDEDLEDLLDDLETLDDDLESSEEKGTLSINGFVKKIGAGSRISKDCCTACAAFDASICDSSNRRKFDADECVRLVDEIMNRCHLSSDVVEGDSSNVYQDEWISLYFQSRIGMLVMKCNALAMTEFMKAADDELDRMMEIVFHMHRQQQKNTSTIIRNM